MPSEWHRPLVDSLRSAIVTLVAPALRALPPWWGARIFGRIAGDMFGKTGNSEIVKCRRVEPHRYKMELQLDDPMDRFTYFVGCYWGLEVTATIFRMLRKGDYFIDVGANIGFLTLTASNIVGEEGKVFSFEPYDKNADRLTNTLDNNNINNVTVFKHALGDVETDTTLDIDDHCSKANLRHTDKQGKKIKIHQGDHVITDLHENQWVFAKVDVEGYELRVLKGFQSLIKRKRTGFLIEVTEKWLMETGGSSDELFNLMMTNGYKAYLPKLTPLSKFKLHHIESPIVGRYQYDVVFIRPDDGWLLR